MSVTLTIHFARWPRQNPWPECGKRGVAVGRVEAVTCKNCQRSQAYRKALLKELRKTPGWVRAAQQLTGTTPTGGTFTVRRGREKKVFRHNQVKTAEKWLNDQMRCPRNPRYHVTRTVTKIPDEFLAGSAFGPAV